jgi:hypothetical protein
MNITLSPELQRRIDEKVERGDVGPPTRWWSRRSISISIMRKVR